MGIHFHKLTGCSPTPLASYLKALGILRLVSEQADTAARGTWHNETFVLASKLSTDELVDFFLTKYLPTPLVSPWNSGSGFLSKDENLEKFERSPLRRLALYQQGAKAARDLCSALNDAKQNVVRIKDEPKELPKFQKEACKNNPEYKARLSTAEREFKRWKESFIPTCRLNWRGPHLEWFEAAIIIKPDLSTAWPSLLGTGGNDGNFDFTSNFRQHFLALFDVDDPAAPVPDKTRDLLSHALFGSTVTGTGAYPIGQYSPGIAGGANSSNGLEGRANVNPWNFILFLEGTVLFSAAASCRLKSGRISYGSAPFALMARSVGHISSSMSDKASRGEQWMPLWTQFATLQEIRLLLGEGRAQLGRASTHDPVEMARAVSRLGVARGISSFERFAYLERNGQSNFAVPLGRWQVSSQPHQELLGDLDDWLIRLHKDVGTSSITAAVKQLDEAIMAATSNATLPLNWQNILFAITRLDKFAAKGALKKAGILTSLNPGWILAADDGTPEFRLALALATQYGIRRHWLSLNKFGRLNETHDASVVCFGRDLIADAIAFVNRRLVESVDGVSREFDQMPILSALSADLHDMVSFLHGGLDNARILKLAQALMALNIKALKETSSIQIVRPAGQYLVDDAFILFRLCFASKVWRGNDGLGIPARLDIFRRLTSGDITTAARFAAQHLYAHGIQPPIRTAVGSPRLLAATMAFPLSRSSYDKLFRSFIKTSTNP